MKKADLEKQLEEYRNRYNAKCSELAAMKKSYDAEIEQIRQSLKENEYRKWKSENEVFLKRFIKEYFIDNMWFETDSDPYSDWATVRLKIEDSSVGEFSMRDRF